jgi:putative hydrolase
MPSGDDLRSLVDRVREGDLLTLTVGEERRAMMDRIQALMAVIEGYAEHVMDVVGRERVDTLDHLRAELDRRRAERSPLGRLLQKLIGLDLKMRQYQLGKAFCDEIASRGGIQALNHVWSSPDAIPTLGELEDPPEWLERTRVLERPE